MIFILTPLLGMIMIIILTVPDPCGNDYDYHSHRALDFGTVKNCDNFYDFRPFHGRRAIVKNCDNSSKSWAFHGSQPIVTKCDEIEAMGQTMIFHAPMRVSSFCSYGRLAMRCGERCQPCEPALEAAPCDGCATGIGCGARCHVWVHTSTNGGESIRSRPSAPFNHGRPF